MPRDTCMSLHWGKVIFSQASVILSTGGCLVLGGSAPGGLLPGGCLVPGGLLPPGGDPPRDGFCCGRCASYWNAFLSNIHWRNQRKCTPGTISFILKQFEKSFQIRMYSSRMRTHCFTAAVAATKCHYCGGVAHPPGWKPLSLWMETRQEVTSYPPKENGTRQEVTSPPRGHRHV